MRQFPLLLAVLGLVVACDSDNAGTTNDTTQPADTADARADTTSADTTAADTTAADTTAVDTTAADTTSADTTSADTGSGDTSETVFGPCDPIDPSFCTFPWPSGLYLAPDDSRVTGYTLDLGTALPRNVKDVPVDSEPMKRLDGYGLGEPLLLTLPNLDTSGLPSEWNVPPSLDADAPILWFEVDGDTLTRIPYWVDIDVAGEDPATRVTIVRPGVILKEDTRYIVAFRDLVDTDGSAIAPSDAFVALREGATADDPELSPRQARFDDIFARLAGQGVEKSSLIIAWDFHTVSSDAVHGPMLHMRDEAFDTVGLEGPELKDIEVETFDQETSPDWAFEIRGKLRVPHYMKELPMFFQPGNVWHFNLGDDGKPQQNGWVEPEFLARVPWTALDGTPHGLIMYGHGQNGRHTQTRSAQNGAIANAGKLIYFGTDLKGMSEEDEPGIYDMLGNLSGFPRMADRLHQGVLNHLLLARAMRERFTELSEVASRNVVVDKARVYYSGISQGGIYCPTIVSLSPDITRGHCSVGGPQYAYILFRSRNFAPFFWAVSANYPSRADQLVVIQAIQQIWNGTDSLSYFRKLHDPFPGNAENSVLITLAKGDVQVPPNANDVVVRSGIGVSALEHYDVERSTISGVAPVSYPHTGSGLVMYAFDNPWPAESVNAPPTSEVEDPHGKPRRLANHQQQLIHFLDTGEVIDVCGGDACTPE